MLQIVRVVFEPPYIYIITTTICTLAGGLGYFVFRKTEVMKAEELPPEEEWKVEKE